MPRNQQILLDNRPQGQASTSNFKLVASGQLSPRQSIAQGIAAAPEAFLGLLKGKNFGKQLVQLV